MVCKFLNVAFRRKGILVIVLGTLGFSRCHAIADFKALYGADGAYGLCEISAEFFKRRVSDTRLPPEES